MNNYQKGLRIFIQCNECQESLQSLASVPIAPFVQPTFGAESIFHNPTTAAGSAVDEHASVESDVAGAAKETECKQQ